MTGHGSKFRRKKEDAVVALLTHRTIEEAARSIGINFKTLLRWQEEPEFKAAYLEARRAAYTQAIARMQQATGTAVSVLLKVMVGILQLRHRRASGLQIACWIIPPKRSSWKISKCESLNWNRLRS